MVAKGLACAGALAWMAGAAPVAERKDAAAGKASVSVSVAESGGAQAVGRRMGPPEPDEGDFRGGGPRRHGMGPGPMGGRFGGGMRPPTQRWGDLEDRLQACQKKFESMEQKREKLIEKLTSEKKDFKPDQIDPGAVVKRQAMDKLLGEYHESVEEGRQNAQEAGDLLFGALMTRNLWEPELKRDIEGAPKAPSAAEAATLARKRAWLSGLDRLEKEGPEGFAKVVLGEKFGPEVVQAMPERWRRPGLMLWRRGDGAASPMRRQLMDNIRQNWMGRIERMERQQDELSKELKRQERELRQMRMILEHVIDEPDAPPPPGMGEAPLPPTPPLPGKGGAAAQAVKSGK